MLLDAFVESGGGVIPTRKRALTTGNDHNHDDGEEKFDDDLCFLTQQPTLWSDSFLVERRGW